LWARLQRKCLVCWSGVVGKIAKKMPSLPDTEMWYTVKTMSRGHLEVLNLTIL